MRYFLLGLAIYYLVDKKMKADEIAMIIVVLSILILRLG